MRFTKALLMCAAAMLSFATDSVAQSVRISPIPQAIQWSEEKAFDNNVAYTIVGETDADSDAIRLLKENFSTEGGSVQLIIGERGDASVAEYENLIPQKSEGY